MPLTVQCRTNARWFTAGQVNDSHCLHQNVFLKLLSETLLVKVWLEGKGIPMALSLKSLLCKMPQSFDPDAKVLGRSVFMGRP